MQHNREEFSIRRMHRANVLQANSLNPGRFISHAQPVAAFLSLLGNERRLLILSHLTEGEVSVGELAVRVGLSKSALSQHLSKLRKYKLVSTRRHRQTIYYSCDLGIIQKITQITDGAAGLAAVARTEKRRGPSAA